MAVEERWGSCRFCGTAVAPGATACNECGADQPIRAGALSTAPPRVRRRIRLTNRLRALIVAAVAIGLAYVLIQAALTGEPTVQDPLTTTGIYVVPPGWLAFLSGNVTGGDYLVGNFTTVEPFGTPVTVSAYNSSGWLAWIEHRSSTPVWSTPEEGSGRIVFTAEYTDTYTFVLTNPYPSTSNITQRVYVATQYESNVGNDGFG